MRQIPLYPGEDGYWVSECPSLPGCVSQGETKAQAIENMREAIAGYVAALAQDHLPVPEEKFEALYWRYEQAAPRLRRGRCQGIGESRL
jgi:predicted RNase H-like HicB family nuclease